MNKELLYVVAGFAVLVLVVAGQLRQREFSPRRLLVMPVVFAAVGVLLDKQIGHELSSVSRIGFFVTGLAIAVVMGVPRGRTIHLWSEHGIVFTRGDWRTVGLWAATLVVRIALATVAAMFGLREGVGEAFVFVAATIAAQNVCVYIRAGRLGRLATALPEMR